MIFKTPLILKKGSGNGKLGSMHLKIFLAGMKLNRELHSYAVIMPTEKAVSNLITCSIVTEI
jgi:hypothetical protein